MKFSFVIGNPPYMEQTESDSTRMPPLYNSFMDESFKVGEKVELITPARFLFNAGYTPKAWNQKMLDDPHFKVLYYEADCTKIFPNTDIKGGVAISYRDENAEFGAIGTFTKYPELNAILAKVRKIASCYLDEIISSPLSYQLTDLMKEDNPELVQRLRSSAFSALSKVFFDEKPKDGLDYIAMIGLENGKRVTKYIRRDYIKDNSDTLDKWTVLVSKANGSGNFGEQLSSSIIAEPGVGYTQTFIGVGKFDDCICADNVTKYIKTKFARAMLGILKITQDCPGPKWKWVPTQDFSAQSDIDWSKSIHEIDLQLYKKYGLDAKEIDFIETHVKEMA